MKKILIIFGVLLISFMAAKAQTRTVTMCSSPSYGTARTCDPVSINCGETIRFYDTGGSGGRHGTGQNTVMTFNSPAGTKMRIAFSYCTLGSGASLQAFNAATATGTAINCSGSPSFTTTSNVCTFKFKSNTSNKDGWYATITLENCANNYYDQVNMPCGSAAMTIGGSLINSESTAYGNNLINERTFTTTVGSHLELTFTDLPNDMTGTAHNDSIVVYNGPDASARIIGSYHGAVMPSTIVSSSNSLTIRVYSNGTNPGTWAATIQPEPCFDDSAEDITLLCPSSSNYEAKTIGGEYLANQFYSQTYRCADPNSKLLLNFTSLPNDSIFDYVEVYDGDLATGAHRGRYYGTNLPRTIYSTGNALTLIFRSNATVNGTWGATINAICLDNLDVVELDCGEGHAINSTYTNLQYTRQVFRATDPNAQLVVSFTTIPHDDDNDVLEVYDGSGTSATLLGRYFGFGTPRDVGSIGNELTIVFYSNATQTGTWSVAVNVDCPDENLRLYTDRDTSYTTCNAMIYDDGGPSGNYSSGQGDHYVVLRPGRAGNVLYLEGEYTFDWQHDYITIYDGEGTSGEVLWGGGLHGHGYPRKRHTSAAHPFDGPDNCINESTPADAQSADGHILKQRLLNNTISGTPAPITCVTYYPKVMSKTGSLTIAFHTGAADGIECEGFSFHAYCVPKPDDCYHTGVVIAKQSFDVYPNYPDPNGVEFTVDDNHPYMQDGEIPQEWEDACSYEFRGDGLTSNDGKYSIRAFACDNYQYFNYLDDHTHPGNIQRGYLFNIDARKDQGDFYKGRIHLNCPGVDKLLVSFWVANVNNQWYLPDDSIHFPKIKMAFYSDEACTSVLAEDSTGWVPRMDMHGCMSDPNDWQYYSLELPNVEATDIWYKISNLGKSNEGNDFAIDDIEVRACLPSTLLTRIDGEHEIFSSANVCAGDTLKLSATLDYSSATSTYETPYYLWIRGMNSDLNDPTSEIVWTDTIMFDGGNFVVDGNIIAYSPQTDIAYDLNGDGEIDDDDDDHYENYSIIYIHETPSPAAPAYSNYYYKVIVAGTKEGVTSQYCYSMSAPYEVTVTRIPEIVFEGTNAICVGGTINLRVTDESPTGGTWSIDSGSGNITGNESTGYRITGAQPNEIVVRYTTSEISGGCYNTKHIPIYPLPTVNITPNTHTLCEGSDITLHPISNQESSFYWQGTGAPYCLAADYALDNTCADWNVVPEVPSSTYNLRVVTTHNILDEDGITEIPLDCVSTASKTITVLPEPDLSVDGIPNAPVCAYTEQTFTPSVAGATGTVTYSWDGGTTWYGATDAGRILTFTPTQDTTCHLIARDTREVAGETFECDKEMDILIEVYQLPDFTTTVTRPLCHGDANGVIVVSATGGTPYEFGATGPYYDFRLGSGSYSHASTGDKTQMTYDTGITQGTYTITVRDSHRCLRTRTVTVNEPDALQVGIGAPVTEACEGQANGVITVVASGGTEFTAPDDPYHYLWNDANAQTTESATGLEAGTYSVTVTDANGCETSLQHNLTTQRPVAHFTITDDFAKCLTAVASSTTSTLTVTLADDNEAEVSMYSWTADPAEHAGMPATTSGASLNSITVTPNEASQTYTYTVEISSTNGCTVTNSVEFTVNPIPSVAVSGTVTPVTCYGGDDGEFTLVATGGTIFDNGPATTPYYYNFTVNGGSSESYYSNTSTQVEKSFEGLTSQTYNVVVSDLNGCTASVSGGVNVPQPSELRAEITGANTTPTCEGQSVGAATVTTNNGGSPYTSPAEPYTYEWNTGETTATIENLAEGDYSVTVRDSHGCTATATVHIDARVVPDYSIVDDGLTKCQSESETELTVQLNASNQATVQSYAWSASAPTGVDAGMQAPTNSNALTVVPTSSLTTPYTVTYTVTITTDENCVVTSSPELVINPTLTLTGTADTTQSKCFYTAITPINITYGGGASGATFEWVGNAPSTGMFTVDDSSNPVTITETTNLDDVVAGTYKYKVTANGALSPCATPVITGTITIYDELTVDITTNHESCATGNIGVATATPDGGVADYTYRWQNSAWESDSTRNMIENLPGGTYNLTVTDSKSCTVASSVSITANPNPVIAIADVETLCPTVGSASVTASITTTTTPNYTYRWTNDGDFAVTTANPISNTTLTTVTSTVSVPNAGCSQTYTLQLQVEDANNCLSNVATKDITVADITTPTITANVAEYPATPVSGCKYKVPDLTSLVTVDDGCTTAALAITQNPLAGDVISSSRNVTITVTDGCNHSDSETIYVTVPDALAVSITTPTNNTCPIASGDDYEFGSTASGATTPYTYSWTTATAVDGHPEQATIESDGRCHTYNIVLLVNDDYGCTAESSVTFSAVDTEDPQITCPTNIPVSTDTHVSTADVTVPLPTGMSDNCTIDYYTNDYTNTTNASGTYPLGTTTVTYTIFDMCGNDETCTFTVTVTDDEPPCIGCDPDDPDPDNPDPFNPTHGISCESITGNTGNVDVVTDQGQSTYTHHGRDWNVDANDNVGVTSITYTVSGNVNTTLTEPNTTLDGQVFGIGITTVTWHVSDGIHTVECEFTVTVTDNQPPCIGCDPDPDDPTVEGISCESFTTVVNGQNQITVSTYPAYVDTYTHSSEDWDITATDNVAVVSRTCVLSVWDDVLNDYVVVGNGIEIPSQPGFETLNGVTFSLGETMVTWYVSDGTFTVPCSFIVNVVDTEDPCIGCDPTDPDPYNPENPTGISCTTIGNQVRDCSPGLEYYVHSNTETAPTDPADPTLTPNWTANWNVDVDDNTGTTGLQVYYTLTGHTTDVTGENTTLDGQIFNIGLTTVTWHAVDRFGNEATCTFTVSVADHEAPCIGCDPDPTDEDPGISCNDIAPNVEHTVSVSTSEHLNYYHHDNNSWDVTATDNVEVWTVTYALYNVDCAVPSVLVEPNTTLNGQNFNIGTTRVVWTAVDYSHNESTCEFYVTVTDNEDPCIGCDPDDPDNPDPNGVSCITIAGTSSGGTVERETTPHQSYYEHDNDDDEDGDWDVTYHDNSTAHSDITVTLTIYDASDNQIETHTGSESGNDLPSLDGYRFPIGTTHVVWTVEDEYGNDEQCDFYVHVSDTEDPCIGCDPDNPDNPDPNGVSCITIAGTSSGGTVERETTPHQSYYEHDNNDASDGNWDVTYHDNSTAHSDITVTLTIYDAR